MDTLTLQAYENAAPDYAREWREQPQPDDLYHLLGRYFMPGRTADVGCGSGRDVQWLAAKGHQVSGYDASDALLHEARNAYPALHFHCAQLPLLEGLDNAQFDNVLCETVIMHLPPEAIGPAVRRLLEILVPGGMLYLSWRVTKDASLRDTAGRLYAAFDKQLVLDEIPADDTLLFDREDVSASSGKIIHRLIVRKSGGELQAASSSFSDAISMT